MEPSPSKFAPLFRDRLRRDVREPRSSWLPGGFLSGGRKDASTFVYERFAARARDGRRVGVADVWGAHLAATLLQSRLRFGGFGLAALRARVSGGDAPLPVFTAVEPLRHGPAWSEATSCERCGAAFGLVLGASRHHCRSCGSSVCDRCCPGFGARTLDDALKRLRSLDVDDAALRGAAWARPAGAFPRRCGVCVAKGVAAPEERTAWRWWALTPLDCAPVERPRPGGGPPPVWIPTTGLGGPHQTSELSISVTSKSIRLIFGRIDCSRRVLEARRKSLVQTVRLRAN